MTDMQLPISSVSYAAQRTVMLRETTVVATNTRHDESGNQKYLSTPDGLFRSPKCLFGADARTFER